MSNNPAVVQVVEEIIEATDGMDIEQVSAAVLDSLAEAGWVVVAKADLKVGVDLLVLNHYDGLRSVDRLREALA